MHTCACVQRVEVCMGVQCTSAAHTRCRGVGLQCTNIAYTSVGVQYTITAFTGVPASTG